MADLISRQAAIEAFWKLKTELRPSAMDAIVDMLKNLPSVQPEIIRCKDCKYYEIAWLKKDGTDNKRYKPSICVKGKYGITRNSDWFCADAERRDAEPGTILCRECKHYISNMDMCVTRWKGLHIIVSPNDFCYKAERRTDES